MISGHGQRSVSRPVAAYLDWNRSGSKGADPGPAKEVVRQFPIGLRENGRGFRTARHHAPDLPTAQYLRSTDLPGWGGRHAIGKRATRIYPELPDPGFRLIPQ